MIDSAQVLSTLDEREEYARRLLSRICKKNCLNTFLEDIPYWAVVGGAVRDALLRPPHGSQGKWWADIDIALTQTPKSEMFSKSRDSQTSRFEVSYNSFGGWKVSLDRFGPVDLWVWDAQKGLPSTEDFWLEQLDSVDFGLNAVAFVWPTQQIIVHPRWKIDLGQLIVEKLSLLSPQQEVQPIRAAALATKMGNLLGEKVSLGQRVQEDLDWLLTTADESTRHRAMHYLFQKIETGRWPSTTVPFLKQAASDLNLCLPNLHEFEAAGASQSTRV